jgi:C1A family cysteine protease
MSVNPKQGLTSFQRVYAAKSTVYRPAMAFGEFATSLADANAVHENDEQSLLRLRDEFSISTVEEVVALARMDTKDKTTLLSDAGISKSLANRLSKTLRATDHGKQLLLEIDRFEQLQYELGYDLDLNAPPQLTPLSTTMVFGAAPAPPAVPSVNLIDKLMAPIRNQGQRGTCVAFTSTAALEYYFGRFRNLVGLNLSEQFQYFNMVTSTGQRNLMSAFPLLKSSGICQETTWPYYPRPIAGNDTQGPAPAQAATEAGGFRCQEVRQLPPRSVADLQTALQRGRIVGIGIPVYNSWMNSGIVRLYGNITVPLPGEVPQTIGHAVALVGYTDDVDFAGGGYFIVRNSWGNTWAPRSAFGPGYGTIPYRYITGFNWDAWCIVA